MKNFSVDSVIVGANNADDIIECLNGTNRVLSNAIDIANCNFDLMVRNYKKVTVLCAIGLLCTAGVLLIQNEQIKALKAKTDELETSVEIKTMEDVLKKD